MSSRKKRVKNSGKAENLSACSAVFQSSPPVLQSQAFQLLKHICGLAEPYSSTRHSVYAEAQRLGLSISVARQAIELLLNRHLLVFTGLSGQVSPTEAALHIMDAMHRFPERDYAPFGALIDLPQLSGVQRVDDILQHMGVGLLHCADGLRDALSPVSFEALLDQLEHWIDYTRPPSKVLLPPLTELHDVLSGQSL